METKINTIYGTYIVPSSKLELLMKWLHENGIKQNPLPVGEYRQEDNQIGKQLLNE